MTANRLPEAASQARPTQPVPWRALLLIAATVTAVLVLTAGRYGYHRDELYFIQAGHHLAWGYADQPPLTPSLARVLSALAPGSLTVLRLPSALAAGLVVVLTGLIARELRAAPTAQLLAAACMAVSSVLLAVGHLLSTSTFDLLAWAGLTWLIVKALQGADQRLWLAAGVLAGVGLLNKDLVLFLLVALTLGLLTVGPRDVLRGRWLWIGAVVALAIWTPNLIWEAANGWPQLELSRAIAGGSSGTSTPKAVFVPYQLVLVSPLLVPVWLAGLWRLIRDPALRRVRMFGWAYVILLVVFTVSGGKPYYLAGLYPVLLAAGAEPVVGWLRRGRAWLRRIALMTAIGLSAAVAGLLMLPLVPVGTLHETPIASINYDAGETVGWPRFVAAVGAVYATLPPAEQAKTVLLTNNYGEAGAIDRYGPARKLPPAFSGHNSFWSWGPPPQADGPVIAVGMRAQRLQQLFGSVQPAGRVDNGVDLDNDEQGKTIWLCRGQLQPWAQAWPGLRRLG